MPNPLVAAGSAKLGSSRRSLSACCIGPQQFQTASCGLQAQGQPASHYILCFQNFKLPPSPK